MVTLSIIEEPEKLFLYVFLGSKDDKGETDGVLRVQLAKCMPTSLTLADRRGENQKRDRHHICRHEGGRGVAVVSIDH